MKRNIILLLFTLNTISFYCQNVNRIVNDLGLPEEYKSDLKNYTFLELLEKSKKYEKANKKEEFEFNGFSNWRKQECKFIERVYKTKANVDILKTIEYYFENQKLIYKDIIVWNVSEIKNSYNIRFYKNGNIKAIDDDVRLKRNYFFDKEGKLIERFPDNKPDQFDLETIQSAFGYSLPIVDPQKIKMSPEKLKGIIENVFRIENGTDLNKEYENFTVEDWKIINQIRDYLNKELRSLNIYKNKDIYYRGGGIKQSDEFLEMIYEDGAFFSIFNLLDEKKGSVLYQNIIDYDEKFETLIKYHPNGNVKSICQSEEDKNTTHPRLLGMNAEYNLDGTVIRDINFEKEFKLKNQDVYSILIKSDKCAYKNNISIEYVNRYYTNYGKYWFIGYHCLGNPSKACISDSDGKVYESDYEFYTLDEYRIKYGTEEITEQEKKLNKRIFVAGEMKCQWN